MTRDEFKIIVKAIKGAYARCPITTQQIFDEWYMLLGDMDYLTVSRNLQRHIRTNKFAPTIAELRNEMPNGFRNFTGRNYDMRKLERALLGVRPAARIEEIKEGRTESD